MKDFAREYHAKHLGNCAMSVAAAWLSAHESDPSEVEKFKTCGAGRAPDGLCGALYAATQFMPEKKDAIVQEFSRVAQGTLCKEIRSKTNMTCNDRVALAAEILSHLEEK